MPPFYAGGTGPATSWNRGDSGLTLPAERPSVHNGKMRFSITALIVLATYVAFFAAAWANANSWIWQSAAFSLMWATLLFAVLGAMWWRGPRQAVVVGFLLFGFTRIWLSSVGFAEARWFRTTLLTSRPLGHAAIVNLADAQEQTMAGKEIPTDDELELVGHPAATLLAGGLGSLAGLLAYRMRGEKKQNS